MEITYTMSPEDIRAFEEYQYRKVRGLGRKQMMWLVIAMVMVAPLIGYFAPGAEPRQETPGFSPLWAVGIPLAIVAVVWLVFRWIFARKTEKLEHEIPGTYQPRTLKLDQQGLFAVDVTGEGRTRWTAVKDVTQTTDRIFILLVGDNGYVIPKSAFRDPADAEQFGQTAETLWHQHGPSAAA